MSIDIVNYLLECGCWFFSTHHFIFQNLFNLSFTASQQHPVLQHTLLTHQDSVNVLAPNLYGSLLFFHINAFFSFFASISGIRSDRIDGVFGKLGSWIIFLKFFNISLAIYLWISVFLALATIYRSPFDNFPSFLLLLRKTISRRKVLSMVTSIWVLWNWFIRRILLLFFMASSFFSG